MGAALAACCAKSHSQPFSEMESYENKGAKTFKLYGKELGCLGDCFLFVYLSQKKYFVLMMAV